MCFEPGYNLGVNDTITFYTVLATVMDGTAADLQQLVDDGAAFAIANDYWPSGCCFDVRGNIDGVPDPDVAGVGGVDIADLVYLVAYSFQGGPPPPCIEEGDVDGSGGAIPIDIADVVYLVAFMFGGGPAPAGC